MAKNIILLSDGTGNSAAKLFKTNVWRLYQALDLSSPDPAKPNKTEQIAYYDDGVGTSSFKPLAVVGGAFGYGLKRNVIHLYTFLCWNYQDGDRVYCFGFSRGAFTIRVLTALIESQGLVHSENKAELKRLATGAFRAYRERYETLFGLEKLARAMRNGIVKAKNRVMRVPSYEKRERAKKPAITFLGLWDTVAAYGLPIDELTRAWNAFFPLSTPNREPSKNVARACHALALDDERNTFHPVLWNEARLPEENTKAKRITDERITQVWFTGMHSNLGGGYPDDALANVSLDWMMGEAERAQLVFKVGERDRVKAAADVCGKLYDSRHGLGGTYRYLPRKLASLTNATHDKKNQVVIKRPKIHESVLERIKRGVDGYAPFVLPEKYAVVTAAGDIVDAPAAPGGHALLEDPTQAESRSNSQERVWNLVWWRRLVYFVGITVVGALLGFPLYRPATPACEGLLCGLSWLVRAAGAVLPGLAGPWLKAYESHPGSFAVLVSLLAALIYTGSRISVGISDRMRAIWEPIRAAPRSAVTVRPLPHDPVFRLRTSWLYQRWWRLMKENVLPSIAGVLAGWAIVGGASQGVFTLIDAGTFSLMKSTWLVCAPTDGSRLKAGTLAEETFSTANMCWPTGVEVRKGKRYRIAMTIDDKNPWRDGDSIYPGVGGFGVEKMTPFMYPGLLFRRHVAEPWFKPVARIGAHGIDEYPLNPVELSMPDEGSTKLVADITARRTGELFLFVNDAVLPVPNAWQYFYRNNHGTATVSIAPATEPGKQ